MSSEFLGEAMSREDLIRVACPNELGQLIESAVVGYRERLVHHTRPHEFFVKGPSRECCRFRSVLPQVLYPHCVLPKAGCHVDDRFSQCQIDEFARWKVVTVLLEKQIV